MKKLLSFLLSSLITVGGSVSAEQQRPSGPPPGGGPKGERPARGQRPGGGGPRPENLGESDAELGSAGIAWYPILEDGLAEAKRTNKPIFFMAVASQCGGISGVFWPGYTATQNREFSNEEVIKATRDYVCIRIDSYESEKAQKIVRDYLNGRFENTAFCLLAPDGKTRLSRSHRSPTHIFGGDLVDSLGEIAKKYKTKGKASEAAVPDFPTFRLGLNVSSADQRIIVLITGTDKELKAARKDLPALSNDPDVIGKFHYDFEADSKTWSKALTGDKAPSQIKIIVPDEYGQSGKVVKSLPLDTKTEDLRKALLEANETFAKTTEKKNYNTHVKEGRQQGIKWTMPMEFGEDRDGDGKIDRRRGQRR